MKVKERVQTFLIELTTQARKARITHLAGRKDMFNVSLSEKDGERWRVRRYDVVGSVPEARIKALYWIEAV